MTALLSRAEEHTATSYCPFISSSYFLLIAPSHCLGHFVVAVWFGFGVFCCPVVGIGAGGSGCYSFKLTCPDIQGLHFIFSSN